MPIKFKQCASGPTNCKVLIGPVSRGRKIGLSEDCCCCSCTTVQQITGCLLTGSSACTCMSDDFVIGSCPPMQYNIPGGTMQTGTENLLLSYCATPPLGSLPCPDISGTYILTCPNALFKRVTQVICLTGGSPSRTLVLTTELSIAFHVVTIYSRVFNILTSAVGHPDLNVTDLSPNAGAFPPGMPGSPSGGPNPSVYPAFRRRWNHSCSTLTAGAICYPFGPSGGASNVYEFKRGWTYALGGTCKTSCNTESYFIGCNQKTTLTDEEIISGYTSGMFYFPPQGCEYLGSISVNQL